MAAVLENHQVVGNAEHGAFLSAAEEMQREQDINERVAEKLADADWWNTQLEGVNHSTNALPANLARAMQNLDRACDGDRIATQAILAALSLVQRAAKADAEPEAEDEWEA